MKKIVTISGVVIWYPIIFGVLFILTKNQELLIPGAVQIMMSWPWAISNVGPPDISFWFTAYFFHWGLFHVLYIVAAKELKWRLGGFLLLFIIFFLIDAYLWLGLAYGHGGNT